MALRDNTSNQISEDLFVNLLEKLPPLMQLPEVECLKGTKSLIHVVFDIETTSPDLHRAEIIQLSAACRGENAPEFNVYITPVSPITVQSRFSTREGILCLDGKPVRAESSAKAALQKFICWLQNFDGKVILFAHNGKLFDAPRLTLHLQKHYLLDDFKANVVGFIDTLIMFKNHLSLTKKPSLEILMEKNIPNYKYKKHDASEDVRALKELLHKTSADIEGRLFDDASFSLTYEIAYVEFVKKRFENNETLIPLFGFITKGMTEKIAGSGLRYCDLQLAFQCAGRPGIERVLSQPMNGKPRVTKYQETISKIYDHFNGDVL